MTTFYESEDWQEFKGFVDAFLNPYVDSVTVSGITYDTST